MTALSFPADHIITGAEWQQFLSFLVPLYVRKPSDEQVPSSTGVQDDDDLYLAVKANAVYQVHGFILYTGDAAGDLKVGWSAPTGATFDWNIGGPEAAVAASSGAGYWGASTLANQEGPGAIGTGTTFAIQPTGLLRTSTTDGTFRLRWAQYTSSATATTIKSGSVLIAHRLS